MAWVTQGTAAIWHVSDLDMLYSASFRLLENAGTDGHVVWFSSMYTMTQFIHALDQRQKMFMKDTGAIVTRATQNAIVNQQRYALPTDWIATRRITFAGADGKKYSLFRTDAYQLDQGMSDWNYTFDAPFTFHESTLPTLQIEIAKAPSDVGTLGLMYIALPTPLSGVGNPFSVPDEFVPYIFYGALGDLLGQDGEGKDVKRAAYCEQRYQQGVELAKAMIRGAAQQ